MMTKTILNRSQWRTTKASFYVPVQLICDLYFAKVSVQFKFHSRSDFFVLFCFNVAFVLNVTLSLGPKREGGQINVASLLGIFTIELECCFKKLQAKWIIELQTKKQSAHLYFLSRASLQHIIHVIFLVIHKCMSTLSVQFFFFNLIARSNLCVYLE